MSAFDHESLLGALSEEEPCGPDLEYDPAFTALEQAARGKPEQQVGDTITPAEEPDWRDVRQRALELCARTRDLRVWLILTRALLRTDGLAGFHDGLRLLADGVERHWATLHPQLDPDDDNDPTLRVNVLMSLCDQETMLHDVSHAPLVASRALGVFGLRDIEIASGKREPVGDQEPIQQSTVDAAFLDAGNEALQATLAALEGGRQCLQSLERMVTEQVGVGAAPSMAPLESLLAEAGNVVRQHLGTPQDEAADTEQAADEEGASAPAAAAAAPGAIRNRSDVIRAFDAICEYFQKHEPSSPIPILVNRAKRLIDKDFMEILEDLVPDGVSQAKVFRGSDDE